MAIAAALLFTAICLYALPAVLYLDDDVCSSSEQTPKREPATGHEVRSWWPPGVECDWRFPDNREPRNYFEGPPDLRLPIVGTAVAALLIAAASGFVGVRDLRR